ncbi:MAG: class I SAM-dependent methyltransferase [Bacteroidetes bacterium]|nr:class I SAM-dependent methyltransferase [Bacteroidota bacterium]
MLISKTIGFSRDDGISQKSAFSQYNMPAFFKKIIYFIYDLLASVVALLLLPILSLTRKYKVENFPIQSKLFQWFGIFPIRDHYYEPKFVYDANFDASKPRDLPILINPGDQLAELQLLENSAELAVLHEEKPALPALEHFYVHNPNFGAGDAELYYLLIRNRRPKRIIEIGSGYSTRLSLLAMGKNRAEGFDGSLTCIEPFEMPFLDAVEGIEVIRKPVETLPISLFERLEANDILFIDSSHIIRPGDDLLFIYFQILPILQKGVLIHIHDIFTPRHYPHEWLTKKMRFWNEQYLLEAFLYNNEGFKILFAVNHLVKTDFEAAKKVLIHLKADSEPSSFWMETN